MLERATKKELEALVNLEFNTNWKIVVDWLTKSQKTLDGVLRTAESPVVFHRAQGANQLVTELIDLSIDARKLLSKGTK